MADDKTKLSDAALDAIEKAVEYNEVKRGLATLTTKLRHLHMPIFQDQVAQCCSRDGQPVIGYHGRLDHTVAIKYCRRVALPSLQLQLLEAEAPGSDLSKR